MALVRNYFSLLADYQKKYGPKTFLLMQVGSFFEVYSEKEDDETMCSFSKMCDLKIASKGEHFMAGFRDYILDKYITKMNDNNYTTVVFIQEEVSGVIQRREYAIYSPGTTFLDDEVRLSNNTSCLWIHKTKRSPCTILFGISNLDIYTGKVDVFEYQEMYYHNPTTYDSIERFISIYNPTEMIVIHNMEEVIINGILQYLAMKSKKLTLVDLNKNDAYSNQAANCEKQPYQTEIIKKFYPLLNKGLVMDTLFEKAIAFQSLCFLLVYVSQHNPSLTHKLCEPNLDKSTAVILANHSLKQLNMIDGEYTGEYSSVLSLLNTCRTKIGKREFQRILLNPIHDRIFLQQSYDMIEHCIKMKYDWSVMLTKLCDIEKINRKIILEKTTPSEYAQLYESCCLLENIKVNDDVWNTFILYDKVQEEIDLVKRNLSSYLNLDVSRKTSELDDTCDNLIRRGVDDSLDRTCRDKIEGRLRFNSICDYLNQFYKGFDKKCDQAFKVHETDKSGISIHITKKRKMFIQRHLEAEVTLNFYSSYTEQNENFTFKPSMIEFKEYNSQTYSLYSKELTTLNEQIIMNSQEFLTNLIRVYKKIHLFMNISYEHLIQCIQKMDVMNTKCEITNKYNYSKPLLVKSDKSFLQATQLRHALIEHLDKNEAYVPNDVCLGKDTQGILLFGTNAVGKTSLIKSIGICIIMAQAGLYVPCHSLEYCPYEYLFTRIIGNDNIFKGLSTFSVEMSELRVILHKCNERSLILGDELCSGTEIDSALSIFISGVEHMYAKESSFIFATHFHSLQNFKEIKEMKGLALKHLTVEYNQEIKRLVYGRTLQDGAGESVYGLEVCKSLMLSDAFLKRAYEIRNQYCNKPSILTLKQTSYSKDKIRNVCEFCRENMGTEIHHLKYQKDAINSHIDSMHMDHPSNLASICETCHRHIHALNLVYEKKKTMDGGYSIILTRIT